MECPYKLSSLTRIWHSLIILSSISILLVACSDAVSPTNYPANYRAVPTATGSFSLGPSLTATSSPATPTLPTSFSVTLTAETNRPAQNTPTTIPTPSPLVTTKLLPLLLTCSANSNKAAVNVVTFRPDNQLLAIGRANGQIELYQVSNWKCLGSFQAHSAQVYALVFSPDGNTLFSGGNEPTVKLWSFQSNNWQPILTDSLQSNTDDIRLLVISPNSELLVVYGGMKGLAKRDDQNRSRFKLFEIWTLKDKKQVLEDDSWDGLYHEQAAFSPDSKDIAIGVDGRDPDSSLLYWSVSKLLTYAKTKDQPLSRDIPYIGQEEATNAITFSPDGNWLASSYGWGEKGDWRDDRNTGFKVWHLPDQQLKVKVTGFDNNEPISWLRFGPDSNRLYTVTETSEVQVWETKNGQNLYNFPLKETQGLKSIDLSQNGKYLIMGFTDGKLKIWE